MPVLPDEITAASFRRRWRGYDRTQVDGLLQRVSTDYLGAIDRVGSEAEDRTRAHAARRDIESRISALTDTARADAEQLRRDAQTDADTIRQGTQRAAALIIGQAEDAATACTRQAEDLRAAAQRDADTARARVESADQRAHQLEDAARTRWDTMRIEAENGFEQLRAAERRLAERIRRAETALNGLRSHVSLLDQVHQAEEILAAVRSGGGSDIRADTARVRDGDHANGHQT